MREISIIDKVHFVVKNLLNKMAENLNLITYLVFPQFGTFFDVNMMDIFFSILTHMQFSKARVRLASKSDFALLTATTEPNEDPGNPASGEQQTVGDHSIS